MPAKSPKVSQIELRHLRYFLAVADELHFGRAAARLGMSQPPLSQQIRQLEELAGVRLFERDRRSVALTDAGRELVAGARQILASVDRVLEGARRSGRGEIGDVTLGFVPSAAATFLPNAIRRHRRGSPNVRVQLREMTTAAQLEAIVRGEVDLGLVRGPETRAGLTIEPLVTEPFVAALPARHPLAARRFLTLAQLRHEAFVLFPRAAAPGFHDSIIALCHRGGFSPRVTQEASEYLTLFGLVAADLGITLAPRSMAETKRTGVVFRPLRGSPERARLDIAYVAGRREAMVAPLVAALRQAAAASA